LCEESFDFPFKNEIKVEKNFFAKKPSAKNPHSLERPVQGLSSECGLWQCVLEGCAGGEGLGSDRTSSEHKTL
jgi:hypothetical protein